MLTSTGFSALVDQLRKQINSEGAFQKVHYTSSVYIPELSGAPWNFKDLKNLLSDKVKRKEQGSKST